MEGQVRPGNNKSSYFSTLDAIKRLFVLAEYRPPAQDGKTCLGVAHDMGLSGWTQVKNDGAIFLKTDFIIKPDCGD